VASTKNSNARPKALSDHQHLVSQDNEEVPFRFADELGPLKLVHIWRPHLSLKAVVEIDNIACRPAIGGARMAPDVNDEEASGLRAP